MSSFPNDMQRFAAAISRKPSPVQFVVPTSIDAGVIGTWLMYLTSVEFRDFHTSVLGFQIFGGTKRDKITPRGKASSARASDVVDKRAPARLITISRECKEAMVSVISYMYSEILLSIFYLHHRAYELEDLYDYTTEISSKIRSGEMDMEKNREELYKWFKAYSLYVSRSNLQSSRLAELDQLISGQAKTRLITELSNIKEMLLWKQTSDGRNSPLVIDGVEDVIILKKPDFEYPLGAMWFETRYRRLKQEQGYPRLKKMVESVKKHGAFTQVPNRYSTILEKFKKDFGANIVSAIQEAGDRFNKNIVITNKFINEVSIVFTNHIFDTAIQFYDYVVGFTDRSTSTTINLRAISTINSLCNCDDLLPLTPAQYRAMEALTAHALNCGGN